MLKFGKYTIGILTVAYVVSGCAKNDKPSTPPVQLTAVQVIEQIEDTLNKLAKENRCDSKIITKAVGTELKDYSVEMTCKDTNILTDLEETVQRLKTSKSLIESNRKSSSPSISQGNAMDAYLAAITKTFTELSDLLAKKNKDVDLFYVSIDALIYSAACRIVNATTYLPETLTCIEQPVLESSISQIKDLNSVIATLKATKEKWGLREKYSTLEAKVQSEISKISAHIDTEKTKFVNENADAVAQDLATKYGISFSETFKLEIKRSYSTKYFYELIKTFKKFLADAALGDLYFKDKGISEFSFDYYAFRTECTNVMRVKTFELRADHETLNIEPSLLCLKNYQPTK